MDFNTFRANYNKCTSSTEAPQQHQPQDPSSTNELRASSKTSDSTVVSFAAFAVEDARRRKELGQKKYEESKRLGGIALETSLYVDVSSTTRKHHHHHGKSSGGGKHKRHHSHRGDARSVLQFTEEGRGDSTITIGSGLTFVAASDSQQQQHRHNNDEHNIALAERDGFLEDSSPIGNVRSRHHDRPSSTLLPQFVPLTMTPSATSDPSPEFTEASHLISVLARRNFEGPTNTTTATTMYHQQREYDTRSSSSLISSPSYGSKYKDPKEAFIEYSKEYVEHQQQKKAASHHHYRKKPHVKQRGPPLVAVDAPNDHITNANEGANNSSTTAEVVAEHDDASADQHTHTTPSNVATSPVDLADLEAGNQEGGIDRDTTPSMLGSSTSQSRRDIPPIADGGDGVLSLIKGSARISHREKQVGKRHHNTRAHPTPSDSPTMSFTEFRESSGVNALDLYVTSCEDAQLRHNLRSLNADVSTRSNATNDTHPVNRPDQPPLSYTSPTSHRMGHHQQLPDPWTHKDPLQFVLPSRNGRTQQQ